MRRHLSFTVPGVEGQRRPRASRAGSKVRVRKEDKDRARETAIRDVFEKAARAAWGRVITAPAGTPVRVAIACSRDVKSDLRKRDGDLQPDTSTPDADNIAKSVLDALNRDKDHPEEHPGAWMDDAQVDELHVYKLTRERGAEPRTVVNIEWED